MPSDECRVAPTAAGGKTVRRGAEPGRTEQHRNSQITVLIYCIPIPPVGRWAFLFFPGSFEGFGPLAAFRSRHFGPFHGANSFATARNPRPLVDSNLLAGLAQPSSFDFVPSRIPRILALCALTPGQETNVYSFGAERGARPLSQTSNRCFATCPVVISRKS